MATVRALLWEHGLTGLGTLTVELYFLTSLDLRSLRSSCQRGSCHSPRRPWLVGGCLLLMLPHSLASMSTWIPLSPSCVDTSNTDIGPSEWPYSTLVASLKTPLRGRETAPSVKCMPCKSRTRVQPQKPTFKKSQVGWCVLVIPVFGKQRHVGPWGLPAIRSNPLGQLQSSERPCLKKHPHTLWTPRANA